MAELSNGAYSAEEARADTEREMRRGSWQVTETSATPSEGSRLALRMLMQTYGKAEARNLILGTDDSYEVLDGVYRPGVDDAPTRQDVRNLGLTEVKRLIENSPAYLKYVPKSTYINPNAESVESIIRGNLKLDGLKIDSDTIDGRGMFMLGSAANASVSKAAADSLAPMLSPSQNFGFYQEYTAAKMFLADLSQKLGRTFTEGGQTYQYFNAQGKEFRDDKILSENFNIPAYKQFYESYVARPETFTDRLKSGWPSLVILGAGPAAMGVRAIYRNMPNTVVDGLPKTYGYRYYQRGAAEARRRVEIDSSNATGESGSATRAPEIGASTANGGVDLILKYKTGWTEAQRTEAVAKAQILNDAPTVVTASERSGTSAAMNRYRQSQTVLSDRDIDHMVDLQLGGSKGIENLWSLDYSVNRSLGSQIYHQIKNLPPGTRINRVTIGD